MKTHLLALSAALCLTACATTSQYTSGQSYLDRMAAVTPAALTASSSPGLQDEIAAIAAVEPDLRLPARIGLARIDRGALVNVPADEMAAWQDMWTSLGADYGEAVPVSPLIAHMVRPQTTQSFGVIDDIRRASARQHLDYVLVTETTALSDKRSNALRAADLTILGLFMLPSRTVEVDATASALLLDVRNGYPYGSASAFAEEKDVSTAVGSRGATMKVSETATLAAVENLTIEVETFMRELKTKSEATPRLQAELRE